jgi:ABC-type transporter Mla MlaB component
VADTVSQAVTVDTLTGGDHSCLTFSDPEERLDILAAFAGEGLDLGHKIVCFAEPGSASGLAGQLSRREVPAAAALETGQLVVHSSSKMWSGSGGAPVASAMVSAIAGEVELATRQGFSQIRVTADMNWAAQPVSGAGELLAFEEAVAALFGDGRLTAICQYDRGSFDPVTLAFAAQTHAKTVAAVAYHDTPLLRICRQHRPPGIRIAGEIDHTALEPLQQALAEALRLDRDIHMNLSMLAFIDVTAASAIVSAAFSLPPTRKMIVTCRDMAATLLRLAGGDQVSQLVVRGSHGPA